ncbi:MAG: carboxypeptidase M32 [Clostridiales Family XIII bacterium]|jgi:carboxypeptidase Taq|nr:carboxypeptidase M32 [Clostridiales Family XIII bacterium]
MSYQLKLDRVAEILRENQYYTSLAHLFMWDHWGHLHSQGQPYRRDMQGYYASKQGELFQGKEVRGLASWFSDLDDSRLESDAERGMIRQFLRLYSSMGRVPAELQGRHSAAVAGAQAVWLDAYERSDYSLYKATLEEMFAIKREIAAAIDKTREPFEVLAGLQDEGIDIGEVAVLFRELRGGIAGLLTQIQNSGIEIDSSCLEQACNRESVRGLLIYIAERMGYSPETGGGYIHVQHPFTAIIGPKDARITSNYDSLHFGLFAGLHEAGHAIYATGANPEVVSHHLWGGNLGGFHESQSRFYENIIGKSKEFLAYCYPEMQRRLPQFQSIGADAFYRAANKVTPSLKRVLADELTYSLHPIIRFEVERALFDGEVDFERLPEFWNDKYEEYLQVRPQNDREGVLQDIHWAIGGIGYFQSYALGNLIGGQLRAALLREIPDVYLRIEAGDFGSLNRWLGHNIHQYGCMYSPNEVLVRATGEKLQSKYFLEYLNGKYKALYQIE